MCRSKTSSCLPFYSTSNVHPKNSSKKIIGTNEIIGFSSQNYLYPIDMHSLLHYGEEFHACSFRSTLEVITSLSSFLDHGVPNNIDPSFEIILIDISLIVLFRIILLYCHLHRWKDLSSFHDVTLCQAHLVSSSSSYEFMTTPHMHHHTYS